MDKFYDSNIELWNEWTEIHKNTPGYDLQGFLKGGSKLHSLERDELGDVAGKSLLHLQCHFGQDTLSWARAIVVSRPYFPTAVPERFDDGLTYADDTVRLTHATTFEWTHPLSEIVESLLDAGLTLTSLGEHRPIPWRALPDMTPTPDGFVLTQGAERVPLTFSLTATNGLSRPGIARA